MNPTPAAIRPRSVGGLIEDGFTVLGRCYRSLLPLAAMTAALGYLATWIIARSALVDGSFAESFADMVRLPDPDVAPTPENT